MSKERNGLALAAISGEIIPEEETYQSRLRKAIYNGVTDDDVKQVIAKIVEGAKSGDAQATRHFFDYVLGAKSKPSNITVHNHFSDVEQGARISKKAAG